MTRLRRAVALLAAHRSARLAAIVLALLFASALLAPLIAASLGVDPYLVDPGAVYASPSAAHLFGTDDLGRDVFARILYGGRVSLAVAVASAAASLALGTAIGVVAGYHGGLLDRALMRLTDVTIAIPRLPLLVILSAVDLSKVVGAEWMRGTSASVSKLILLITLFGWVRAARLARASALQVREMDFVLAARAIGASDARIILVHVLPHTLAPIVVAASLEVGETVLYESVLSFLGLGVAPPVPSWGAMLANGFTYLYEAPLLLVLPGLFTFMTVAAFNLLGDAARDALDPRLRPSRINIGHARERAIG